MRFSAAQARFVAVAPTLAPSAFGFPAVDTARSALIGSLARAPPRLVHFGQVISYVFQAGRPSAF